MRKVSGKTVIITAMLLLAVLCPGMVSAGVWEFGTSGTGQNPFTPRGYLIDAGEGTQFLSSPFRITASSVEYTGVNSGVDYIDAQKPGGGTYTFYAMTDRNPWPKTDGYVGKGQIFLFACKNGSEITDFSGYVDTPPIRAGQLDPSGGSSWVFRISGMTLSPGSIYEFGYLCGMQANNGVTLVPAFNERGAPIGYISQTGGEISPAERRQYNDWKYEEYQFVSGWSRTGDGYDVKTVPMRFSVQTYADLSRWEEAAGTARDFLRSVTGTDLRQGKYRQENLDNLRTTLSELDRTASEEVKYHLQEQADEEIGRMVQELADMEDLARSDRPEQADTTKLEEALRQAEELLIRAGSNTGINPGQYGRVAVQKLASEIAAAKQLHDYSPQKDVDRQTNALRAAIDAVVDSRVREQQRVFYDKVTGIYVIAPEEAVPEKTSLTVRRMGRNSGVYRSMQRYLDSSETEAVYYSMSFYLGDRRIQPSDTVEVQMPADSRISRRHWRICSAGEQGRLKQIPAEAAGDRIIFRTRRLGDFVLAGSEATEEERTAIRQDQFRELMMQRRAEKEERAVRQLQQEAKIKEDYRDPLNRMLNRDEAEAAFTGDVKRRTNPAYLLVIAAALGATGVAFGIRGVIAWRRREDE